jgi:chaperonin GroEL (HSP60 family)
VTTPWAQPSTALLSSSAYIKTTTITADIALVATISINGNVHVGYLIVRAMEKVGEEGSITLEHDGRD